VQALKSQPDDTVLLGYITKAECVEFFKGELHNTFCIKPDETTEKADRNTQTKCRHRAVREAILA